MPEDFFLQLLVTQAWQIALLAVFVAFIVRFFAARRPQVAYWLWLIVIVKCVTPPLWGHSLGLFSQIQSVAAYGDTQTDVAAAPAVESNMAVGFAPASFADDQDVYPVESEEVAYNFDPELLADEFGAIAVNDGTGVLDAWAFTTWTLIAGMIASLLWLSWKFARCLRRIYAHRVTEFDDEIESVVTTLAKELSLRRVPRVIISDVRFGPAVLGIFRHLIVLPKCLIADEGCRDPKTLRPILAHELLHIRRGDLWTGTLQAAVQCLWWFHPAVWMVNRLLSRETERSCDEQVVAELGCSPLEYARSLLAVIECKHSLKPVPVFPGMKPVEITSQRMERIMSLTQGSRTRMPWWSVVAVVLFAAVVLPGAVIGQQVAEIKQVIDAESGTENWNGSTGPDKETSEEFAEPNTTKINLESDVSDASPGQTQVHKAGFVYVGGAVTTPVFLDISAAQGITLIEAIAHAGGLSEQAGDIVMVRRKSSSGSYTQLPALSLKAPLSDADASVLIRADDVITVESLDCCLSREKLAKKVTLRFASAPLESVLRLIATEYDVKFAIETGSTNVNHKISIAVDEVPLEEALELICEQCNLTFVDEHEVIKITSAQPKPASVVEPETYYALEVYPVADLVLPVPGAVPTTKRQPLAINHTQTEKFLYELQSDMVERNFTSLIELIRTTVEPDSWHGVFAKNGAGRLKANGNTLSIVIRQKPEIHDEIVELLGQLRLSQGRTVVTTVELLIFHTSQQIAWLEKNVKFHQHMNNHPWALVPSNRTNHFLAKAKENSNAFAYGSFTSFAGKLVSLTVSGREKYDLSVHLKGTPLAGDNLIEMEYGAKLSKYAGKTRPVGTQVMNHKQTLLFDLSVKSADPKFRAVAVVTPSIVHGAKLDNE